MPRVLTTLLHRSPRRGLPQPTGFALPMAVGGALLLLLSSSSLQLLAWQSRVQVVQQQRRLQLEDTLASAAQHQVAALAAEGPCLLGLELAQWAAAAASCGLSHGQLAALQQGQFGAQGYRLTAYRPAAVGAAPSSAELELVLTGDRPWRAGYRLALAPGGTALRVTAVQDLGLRGVGA